MRRDLSTDSLYFYLYLLYSVLLLQFQPNKPILQIGLLFFIGPRPILFLSHSSIPSTLIQSPFNCLHDPFSFPVSFIPLYLFFF